MSEQKIELFMQEGSADKVYMLHLHPCGGGWVVERGNARRGSPLRMGFICGPAPVTLDKAQAAYEKKLKEQLREGYKPSEREAAAYASAMPAGARSDHRQQLPTAITEDRAALLLDDPAWVLQEKANGERRTVQVKADGQVLGINKLGLFCPVPDTWTAAFASLAAAGGALIDCEQIGEHLHAFDLLERGGKDLRAEPFSSRASHLSELARQHPAAAAAMTPLQCFTLDMKRKAAQDIEARGGEGYVLKRAGGVYQAGRSGDSLKFKFTESSSFVVMQRNAQRSVAIGLLDAAGELRGLCNVTIPANHEVPEEGAIAEVQYLYYNPHGGLEQPVYLGKRNDIERQECHFGQILRLKPGVEMPAELFSGPAAHAQEPEEDFPQPERMRA